MNQQQSTGAAPDLVHNEAQSRYELHLGGRLVGKAQYQREGDRVRFTHTEVDPAHQRRGLASRLAAHALDDVKARGLKAVPQCSFIAGYIARHRQAYGALLTE